MDRSGLGLKSKPTLLLRHGLRGNLTIIPDAAQTAQRERH